MASIDSRQSTSRYDNFAETLRLREQCGKFRILVIGRANAGKTTICQRMCNTTSPPVVRDRSGRRINVSPNRERGAHNINDEITYQSNPGFVFHDSGGFESGSDDELNVVRSFIETRSKTNELNDRLHAIWFCLPVDNDRPFVEAEMKFFEEGTHPVPVIGVFTKCDAQRIKARARLRKRGFLLKDITEQEVVVEMERHLQDLRHTWNTEAAHPPAAYCFLQDIQEANKNSLAQCIDLAQITAESIDNKVLKWLFVSVQRLNTEICIKYAIQQVFDNYDVGHSWIVDSKQTSETLVGLYSWFPHTWIHASVYNDDNYNYRWPLTVYPDDCAVDVYFIQMFQNNHLLESGAQQDFLTYIAGFLITAEISFWFYQLNSESSWEEASISAYMSSPTKQSITAAIHLADLTSMDQAKTQSWFTWLVLDNLLPRPGVD